MPIYEYRCAKCGFQKEFLQRLNDAPLTKCPECGKRSFKKMVTAAGFQLKGTGWYATDFKNSGSSAGGGKAKPAEGSGKESATKDSTGNDSKGNDSKGKDSKGKDSKGKDAAKSESGGGAAASAV